MVPRGATIRGMARPGFFAIDSLGAVHVLLVDDDPASSEELLGLLRYCGALVPDTDTARRTAMQAVFSYCSALVTLADSVDAALASIARLVPEVIVCGLAPDGDGGALRFVERLRALPARAGGDIPAVVVID